MKILKDGTPEGLSDSQAADIHKWDRELGEKKHQSRVLEAAEAYKRKMTLKAEKFKAKVGQEFIQAQVNLELELAMGLALKEARQKQQESLTKFTFVLPRELLSEFKQAVVYSGSVSSSEVLRLLMAGFISNQESTKGGPDGSMD